MLTFPRLILTQKRWYRSKRAPLRVLVNTSPSKRREKSVTRSGLLDGPQTVLSVSFRKLFPIAGLTSQLWRKPISLRVGLPMVPSWDTCSRAAPPNIVSSIQQRQIGPTRGGILYSRSFSPMPTNRSYCKESPLSLQSLIRRKSVTYDDRIRSSDLAKSSSSRIS